jgi:hypothetical protein
MIFKVFVNLRIEILEKFGPRATNYLATYCMICDE